MTFAELIESKEFYEVLQNFANLIDAELPKPAKEEAIERAKAALFEELKLLHNDERPQCGLFGCDSTAMNTATVFGGTCLVPLCGDHMKEWARHEERQTYIHDLETNIVPDLKLRIAARDELIQKQGPRKLQPERPGVTHKFTIHGIEGPTKGYITVGFFEDSTVGEVFLKLDKQGSSVSGFCDAWAISASMLLQAGTQLETLIDKFKAMRFDPAGRTDTPGLRVALSPIDYTVRYLHRRFIEKKPLEDESDQK